MTSFEILNALLIALIFGTLAIGVVAGAQEGVRRTAVRLRPRR